MSTTLVKYEAARQALAEAHRVDEVKGIRDKAVALAAYAEQAKDPDLLIWATEIQFRAEAKAGGLLRETAKAGQRERGGKPRKILSSTDDGLPTLKDLGITRNQSSTWQKLAAIPVKEFEARLEAASHGSAKATTARMLRPGAPSRAKNTPKQRLAKDGALPHLIQALTEAREWMQRWQHLDVLAPVFEAIITLGERVERQEVTG